MSLIDRILNKEEKKKEIKLQQGVDAVQTALEESDSQEEAYENAILTAIKEIQSHPEMPSDEFINKLQNETGLPNTAIVQIIKDLHSIKPVEVADVAVKAAVEATDLSSPQIVEIIEDTPLSPNTAQKIVEQIPDESIQKEQQEKLDKAIAEEKKLKAMEEKNKIKDGLEQIYKYCEDLEAPDLVSAVENLPLENYRTKEIEQKIVEIVAKRTALDCMKYGVPRLPTLARLVPASDLLEADLPFLAQKEYKNIKSVYNENNKDYHDYGENEKVLIRNKLLEMIAKDSAKSFDTSGFFNIPKTEQLQNLSKDEIDSFINTVKTYSREHDDSDIARLAKQLNGDSTPEIQDIDNILNKMKHKDEELVIQFIFDLLKLYQDDKSTFDTLSTTFTKILKLPISKQSIVGNAINNVLDEKQSSVNMIKNIKDNSSSKPNNDEKEIGD